MKIDVQLAIISQDINYIKKSVDDINCRLKEQNGTIRSNSRKLARQAVINKILSFVGGALIVTLLGILLNQGG